MIDNVCVLAHELGHAYGMDHVEEFKSLMHSFSTYDTETGECYWSVEDQKEFDRVKYSE